MLILFGTSWTDGFNILEQLELTPSWMMIISTLLIALVSFGVIIGVIQENWKSLEEKAKEFATSDLLDDICDVLAKFGNLEPEFTKKFKLIM